MIAPQKISEVIDRIVGDSTKKQRILLLLGHLAVTLVGGLGRLITTYVSNRMDWKDTNWMWKDLNERCLKQMEESLQKFKFGEMMESINGDVQKRTNFSPHW